jgi:hypothetical protein
MSRGFFKRLADESQATLAPAQPTNVAATVTLCAADLAKLVAPAAPVAPPPPPPAAILKPASKYVPRRRSTEKAEPSLSERFRHLSGYVALRPMAPIEEPPAPPPPRETAKTLAAKMIAAARRGVAL